ncbi:MAG: hypothetical protein ACRCVQ_07410 [Acinetobacter ursingii]
MKYRQYRSWRHTPFRNVSSMRLEPLKGSWRHTPFRNLCGTI